MATNHMSDIPTSEAPIKGKLGLFKRLVRAYWQANERIFLAAITDPKTGRPDRALERHATRMMLR